MNGAELVLRGPPAPLQGEVVGEARRILTSVAGTEERARALDEARFSAEKLGALLKAAPVTTPLMLWVQLLQKKSPTEPLRYCPGWT